MIALLHFQTDLELHLNSFNHDIRKEKSYEKAKRLKLTAEVVEFNLCNIFQLNSFQKSNISTTNKDIRLYYFHQRYWIQHASLHDLFYFIL